MTVRDFRVVLTLQKSIVKSLIDGPFGPKTNLKVGQRLPICIILFSLNDLLTSPCFSLYLMFGIEKEKKKSVPE